MGQNQPDDGEVCQGKTNDHGALAAHPVRQESHRDAQQERRERRRGVDQAEEVAAVTGVNDVQVEEQAKAAEQQAVEEESQQEQPRRPVEQAELVEGGVEEVFHFFQFSRRGFGPRLNS